MNAAKPVVPRRHGDPELVFAPLAWLKLQLFCHLGDTEIGGFAITAENDPLYVTEFVSVRQQTSTMTVSMEDDAVADYADQCVDLGLSPQNFMRIWCHSHPGASPDPSSVDEDSFARVFGSCDWAVMFILSRTARTYARLSFHAGPGCSVLIPVSVDWAAWPRAVAQSGFSISNLHADWQMEFSANIHRRQPVPQTSSKPHESAAKGSPWEHFGQSWEWTDLDQQLLEDFELHERLLNADPWP